MVVKIIKDRLTFREPKAPRERVREGKEIRTKYRATVKTTVFQLARAARGTW